MTIDRQHGYIIILCDGDECIEALNTQTRDIDEVRAIQEREGWHVSKATGEWKNYCPGCAAEIMGKG